MAWWCNFKYLNLIQNPRKCIWSVCWIHKYNMFSTYNLIVAYTLLKVCVCAQLTSSCAAPSYLQPLHHLTIKVWTAPDKIRAMRTKPLRLWGEGKIGQLRWQRQQEMAPLKQEEDVKSVCQRILRGLLHQLQELLCVWVCVVVCVWSLYYTYYTVLYDVLGSMTNKDFRQTRAVHSKIKLLSSTHP